jgi:hypothetical protein
MRHYTVELRIREAGDVGDALPVKAFVELPARHERIELLQRHHETIGGAVQWAIGKVTEWMRKGEGSQ